MTQSHLARYGWILLTGFVCALGFVLLAHDASAQASGYTGHFVCIDNRAYGTLYTVNPSCPTTLGFDHIFSFLVCNMESLSSNLLGQMFCGMVFALTPAVSAVLVLSTIFFGIGFTIGVIPATAREFQVFLLKVATIWIFATQADYLIGIGYKLLVDGMRDGVDLVLGNFGVTPTTITVYNKMDLFTDSMVQFAARYVGIDKTKGGDVCKDAIFAALAVMAVAFPPFGFLAVTLLIRVAVTFFRAVFGYIYAMIGIAFLLTLAPFFLSFYLFRQTRQYFEKWLGYMVSFSLQIVIMFAFLAFILSINTSRITGSYSNLVMQDQTTKEGGSFRAPWEYCTLCDFMAVDDSGRPIPENQYAQFIGKGTLVCKTNPPTPIKWDTTLSPDKGRMNTLLKFTSAGLFSLLILAYILEGLLTNVAYMAQTLAAGMSGGMYAPQLGGGTNPYGRQSVRSPFDGAIDDFESGFGKGFAGESNSISGMASGVAGGMRKMITGKDSATSTTSAGGFGNRFVDWLTDPANMGTKE